MTRAVPTRETNEPTTEEVVQEARALREGYRHDPEGWDHERSPQAFYERAVDREDVREMLRRLSKA